MRRKIPFCAAAVLVAGFGVYAFASVYSADVSNAPLERGDTVIFVRNQQLFFDSKVNGPLPQKGNFQLLEDVGGQLETDFGPGDPGYLGGRWKLDSNGDNTIDTYFSCPLLPPGRETR